MSSKTDKPSTEAKLLSLVSRSRGQDFSALIEWNTTITSAQAEIDEARARCANELRELKVREAAVDAERARLDCAIAAAAKLQEVEAQAAAITAERDQLRATLDEMSTAQRVAINTRRGRAALKIVN